ncbi:MAG: VTT domain-containing protein [Propionibacteriaceae bacterium]|nr:VTT domain-containing protein [Propionibacteriaceae bacterium]
MDPTTWQAPFAVVVGALFVIVMLRANATYWLGRAIIAGAGRSRWARLLDTRAYRTGSSWLNRWGPPAVALSFLTVGVQTMVNLSAGVSRMPMRRYLPSVTVGSVIWAFLYGTVGFAGFVAIKRLWTLNPALTIGAAVLLVAVLALVLTRKRAKPPVAPVLTPDTPEAEAA